MGKGEKAKTPTSVYLNFLGLQPPPQQITMQRLCLSVVQKSACTNICVADLSSLSSRRILQRGRVSKTSKRARPFIHRTYERTVLCLQFVYNFAIANLIRSIIIITTTLKYAHTIIRCNVQVRFRSHAVIHVYISTSTGQRFSNITVQTTSVETNRFGYVLRDRDTHSERFQKSNNHSHFFRSISAPFSHQLDGRRK